MQPAAPAEPVGPERHEPFLGALLSALAYTLMLIFTGFLMRSARVLNDAEVGGLSRFCGLLALPCALFASVVDLDWSSVDWTLLLGMFISKAIIFAFTALASLSRSRSPEAIARAGLFAVFTTKSNDIAFALPIVSAIFPPIFAKMVYLFVPLQLAIINPVGLMMMEYGSAAMQQQRNDERGRPAGATCRPRSPGAKLLIVFCSTLSSPVMIAVVLGLVLNLTARGRIPTAVSQFVQLAGQAYTSTALLTVGTSLSIVGKRDGVGAPIDGISALVGTSLIFVKVFVAALVMYHVCGLLTDYDTQTISFAFVYGCMPPAPTVYVWARQYGICTELTGRMLVVSLLVATPFIVITGLMIDLGATRGDLASTRGLLDAATQSIDALAICCCVWMVAQFAVSRQMRSGFRAELLPLVLCNAASSLSAVACIHSSTSRATKLPVDVVRQFSQHLAVALAAALAVRLFRSLRTSPERMRAERPRFHAACVAAALFVTACQLSDRSGPRWPRGDPRSEFQCVFGLLNSRAPYVRICFLTLAVALTLLPLLLFNARYLRTELRLNRNATDQPDARAGAACVECKWAVAVLRTGGGAAGTRRARGGQGDAGWYDARWLPALQPLVAPQLSGAHTHASLALGAAGGGAERVGTLADSSALREIEVVGEAEAEMDGIAPACPLDDGHVAAAGGPASQPAARRMPPAAGGGAPGAGAEHAQGRARQHVVGSGRARTCDGAGDRGASGPIAGGPSAGIGACGMPRAPPSATMSCAPALLLPTSCPPIITSGVPRALQPLRVLRSPVTAGTDTAESLESARGEALATPPAVLLAAHVQLALAQPAHLGGEGGGERCCDLQCSDDTSLGSIMQSVRTARARARCKGVSLPRAHAGGARVDDEHGEPRRRGQPVDAELSVAASGLLTARPASSELIATWHEQVETGGRNGGGADVNGGCRVRARAAADARTSPGEACGEEGESNDDDAATPGEWDEAAASYADDLDDGAAFEAPWVEIRITRARRPVSRASRPSLALAVSQAIATAAAAREAEALEAAERASGPSADGARLYALSEGLLAANTHGGASTRALRAAPAPPSPLHVSRRRSNSLNYIPMMESLVWGSHHETEAARDTHVLELNDTFNDSIRYLILLTAAIFSMVLGLSTALQDASLSSVGLTMLQEEIVVVTKLAFHGQVLLMTACFGLHPDYVLELRQLRRRALYRLRASRQWQLGMRLRTAFSLPASSTDLHGLGTLRRQFAVAKARFE